MKKLTKSNNRVFAGVCGGIGEYFNIDPVIVRLVYAIITISGVLFPGIIIYIVAAIIIPSADDVTGNSKTDDYENLKSANVNEDDNPPHSDKEFDSYFKK